jgi:translation initiation factor 1
MSDDGELVYDSESGDLRGSGGGKKGGGRKGRKTGGRKREGGDPAAQAAKDGRVRVTREKKGRGGKTVTVLYGLSRSEEEMEALAKELKKRCGTGGTVKGSTVEVQGDNVETVLAVLEKRGISAVRAGG